MNEVLKLIFTDIENKSKPNFEYFENERNILIEKRNVGRQNKINNLPDDNKINLSDNYDVLRVAPSPTGQMHIGTLYMSLISRSIADKSVGYFYLRIEDTDKLREIEGSREEIIKTLYEYNIKVDEIYIQSDRVDAYKAYAKKLLEEGKIYPCFMTEEDLEKMREEQTVLKQRPGVYGKYAKSRELTQEEIILKLKNNEKYVLRLKANGDVNKKNKIIDLFLGEHNIPENDEDFVILKSDGVPTYHFAHVIDDYLLGTTIVTRGEEWLSSMPKHLELWKLLGFTVPTYAHIMPINITEVKNGKNIVRKLSKRKDIEAGVSHFYKKGYPKGALLAYLYRLANPNFDDYFKDKIKNKNFNVYDYNLNLEEMKRSSRGPLLDTVKLNDISSNIIGNMSKDFITENILNWAKENDQKLYDLIIKDQEYFKKVINIEREVDSPRKDIVVYQDTFENVSYFYDYIFDKSKIELTDYQVEMLKNILKDFGNDELYKYSDTNDLDNWVNSMKSIYNNLIQENNFDSLKFGEFMMIIRKALTGKEKTPNLFYIMNVLGKEKVLERVGR